MTMENRSKRSGVVSPLAATDPSARDNSAAPGDLFERHIATLERQFVDLQRQVQQLQRMASVGTMTAVLAHEINNLLTPMITYTKYALSKDDVGLLRTAVEKSNKNATRLAALCQRMLGYSSGGPGQAASALPVRMLLTEAVETIGRELSKDQIALTIDAPDGLQVLCDAGAIQQVLFNLVINAWQAMSGCAGRLALSAYPIDQNRVSIEVTDTGIGISPEHLSRVFEPFFTTKGSASKSYHRGSGLGLHVCRQLVNEQGGTIEVRSRPGEGTTFTVTLPRAGDQNIAS